MQKDTSKATLLPIEAETLRPQAHRSVNKHDGLRHAYLGLGALLLTGALFVVSSRNVFSIGRPGQVDDSIAAVDLSSFYSTVNVHDSHSENLCPGMYGKAISHSGYIGLKDDTPEKPRRSFFW